MAYNILGINPFHNGSVCVLSDGEIVYFLEEERLSKQKQDANPFRVILDVLDKFKIDEIVIGGINTNDSKLGYTNEDPFFALIRKFYPKIPFTSFSNYHHYSHISHSYYNSGFNNALGIVIDAGGSGKFDINGNLLGLETDSIYICTSNYINNIHTEFVSHNDEQNGCPINIAMGYGAITTALNFKIGEEGKIMGLSSYGKINSLIPPLFIKNKSNPNLLLEVKENGRRKTVISEFLLNESKKDLAWRIQNDTQQIVGDCIEKYIKETGLKQVCCAGGYFLNCVANYYLKKRFPNINFYFEPISHDGGTAIGVAYWRWKKLNPNFQPKLLKSLYLGPQYSKKHLLKGIKKYI